MTRQTIFTGFFFTLLVVMILLACQLLAPFFGPLLLAAVLAIVFFPLHLKLGRWTIFHKHASAHALASTLMVVFLFIVPLGLLIWAVAAEADSMGRLAHTAAQKISFWFGQGHNLPESWMRRLPVRLTTLWTEQLDALPEKFDRWAGRSVGLAAAAGAELAKNAFGFLIGFALLVFALFFMFRDGDRFYAEWNRLLPMPAGPKKRLDDKIHSTIIGVVRGSFITALAQTLVSVVGFLIVRAPAILLLGLASFAATILPGIGPALIWAPVAVYYLIVGSYFRGLFLIFWGIFATGLIDNVLRPFVVGRRLDMSVFWLFLSILGGLKAFGVAGLLLGPLIITVLVFLLDIYRDVYLTGRALQDD
jgi:predicted PurR-regulated permease PerM